MRRHRDPLHAADELIPRVYAYVAYRIGPGPDAEDVTSDVFERALRYRHRYDPALGEPAAWLTGIARRCIADRAVAGTVAEARAAATPGDMAEDSARRLDLAAAVAQLDPRERELIALRFGADLTARQIGTLLDLRPNTVEVALHRALSRLRGRLTGGRTGEDPAPQAAAALHTVRI